MIVIGVTLMVMVLFFANMYIVYTINEDAMIKPAWLRRLMMVPPFGILSYAIALILLVLRLLFIFAIKSIKKFW